MPDTCIETPLIYRCPNANYPRLKARKQVQTRLTSAPGTIYALFLGMLMILASGLGLGIASFGTLALMVHKAPEGYEDKDGFHLITRATQVKRHGKGTSFVGRPAPRNA